MFAPYYMPPFLDWPQWPLGTADMGVYVRAKPHVLDEEEKKKPDDNDVLLLWWSLWQ